MPNSRVLVAGTTPDYIEAILCRYPGRAVFVTDRRVRAHATEPRPAPEDELLCDLGDPATVLASLREHLRRHDQEPAGVACFDCESLALASFVASALNLPFPSAEAVTACRSKLECKRRWRRAGVACPRAGHASSEAEARAFLEKLAAPAVLKPLTGSGSELTFQCDGPEGLASAFRVIHDRLAHHGDGRMYATRRARHVFALEEFIRGDEYSADFIVEDGQVRIIRVAGKLPAKDQTFGVTRAYIVPADLPPPVTLDSLAPQLLAAARAAGLRRALCMADFFLRGEQAVFIEIAPRPGGDCLPPLIEQCCGLDMLGATLDFAQGLPVAIPPASQWKRLVGLRFFADRAGVVKTIAAPGLDKDPRVLARRFKAQPGRRIALPPEDYDTRVLGHAIFSPAPGQDLEAQCLELAGKVEVGWE